MCLLRLPTESIAADYLSHASIVPAPMSEVPPYEPFAVVPGDLFLPYASSPLKKAQAIALERLLPTVSLVRLADVVATVVGCGIQAQDAAGAKALAITFPLEAAMAAITAAMRATFVWSASRYTLIGLAHGAPGKRTTTINPANGHRLGLHFDSWDMLPLHNRSASRYRLSVNVGTSDRFFLFVAMSAVEALQIVETRGSAPRNATMVFREAQRARPTTNVYRLRVPPGWAYVAPTDNLPHDGSTLGAESFDLSLHALADFRPLKRFFETSSFLHLR
jgi:hypothetical protein